MKPEAKLRALFDRLDALYARIQSTIVCRGRCHAACGVIPMTELEARRLQLATHTKPRTVIRLSPSGKPIERCIYLTQENRCGVYAIRPFICRVYALVRAMSCPHGCAPDRWMNDIEFVEFAKDVERLGGRLLFAGHDGVTFIPGETFLKMRPMRPIEEIEEDSERTRNLRALHGGRILWAGKERP